jgi:hypothetical protein
VILLKKQNTNVTLKEYKNRERQLEENINKHPIRTAITAKRRKDISVYRKLVSFSISADDVCRNIAGVFKQLGIRKTKDQYGDPSRIQGFWEEESPKLYSVQTVCIPVDDATSLLTFDCAPLGSGKKAQIGKNASPLEIDRLFNGFLGALGDALCIENASISVQMTVISDVKMLAIRTSHGLSCTVILTQKMAIFTDPATGRTFCVSKNRAREEIVFQANTTLTPIAIESKIALVSGVGFNFAGSKKIIVDWLPPLSFTVMKNSLRGWGGGLILVGVISILLPNTFDFRWGIVLIILGILNLFIIHRALFVINGLVLIAAGIMNIINLFSSKASNMLWSTFSLFQIGWGVQELTKFSKYRNTKKEKPEEKKG